MQLNTEIRTCDQGYILTAWAANYFPEDIFDTVSTSNYINHIPEDTDVVPIYRFFPLLQQYNTRFIRLNQNIHFYA
jgi:hypothetical protein